jgi:hypothetical protein
MFACSCCIVIEAFVPSREGQIYKSTPDGGARSQFRELSPFRWLSTTSSLDPFDTYITYAFQPQPSACYFMHDMILLLRDKLLWPPSLRTSSQFIFILLGVFVTNDLRKGVSFQNKMFFQNGYDEGLSPLSPLSRMIKDSLV